MGFAGSNVIGIMDGTGKPRVSAAENGHDRAHAHARSGMRYARFARKRKANAYLISTFAPASSSCFFSA